MASPREYIYATQTDLRCADGHEVKRERFHTGPDLDVRVQVVSCDRCGVLLSSHTTRDPRGDADG